MAADALRNTVLSFLSGHPDDSFRPKEISQELGLQSRARYRAFVDVVADLEKKGEVRRVRGGRLQIAPKANAGTEGVISVNRQGHGFVALADGTEVFVQRGRLKTALDGDTVRVALAAPDAKRDPERLREAEVLGVVARGRAQAVGTFETKGSAGWVKPDDNRLGHDVYVPKAEWNGATTGDKVIASIDTFDDPKSAPEGRILSILGRADAPGVDVLALAVSHGAKPSFPDAVERDAADITGDITEDEIARRLDLRDMPIFTIDPADAKDFDDAIHTRDLGDGLVEVGVHIADVSHYVRPGSAIDVEGYDRATSTYLVDRVIPMLPEALSNGVCSLRPHEDKLAYSCILTLDWAGTVHSHRFVETVIHSKHRFTYESAQAVLDGEDDTMMARRSTVRATSRRRSPSAAWARARSTSTCPRSASCSAATVSPSTSSSRSGSRRTDSSRSLCCSPTGPWRRRRPSGSARSSTASTTTRTPSASPRWRTTSRPLGTSCRIRTGR